MTTASASNNTIVSSDIKLKVLEVDATSSLVELENARKRMGGAGPHEADAVGAAGQFWIRSLLSPEELDVVRGFKSSSDESLLLRIRNFPQVANVPTPTTGFLSNKDCVLYSDLLLFGMISLMEVKPYPVDYENNGKMVRNIVPVASASGTASSWGADTDFFWHTDNPNNPFLQRSRTEADCIPLFLAFTSIRNIEQVPTMVASVDELLERLPDWVKLELRRQAYSFSPPASNESQENQDRILPILETLNGISHFRFDDNVITPIDHSSDLALTELRKYLARTQGYGIILELGDFFIFKNERIIHRRKAFIPQPSESARWLRRIYGS